jgi:hypothetical protein
VLTLDRAICQGRENTPITTTTDYNPPAQTGNGAGTSTAFDSTPAKLALLPIIKAH